MFIYRDEYYNPDTDKKATAEVIIAKHRNGPVGKVDLYFEKNLTNFQSITTGSYVSPP
jgi:replicative DNA helicase